MNISPLDLKRQYKTIKHEVVSAVLDVFESQHFILGKTVADFEQHMAAYCGTTHAVGCANGTDAILLSLMAAGIGAGDEVLVPSFTFIASAEPIASLGAKPVFCDIDERTYNIDPQDARKKITKKTAALIAVHLYGQTADMTALCALAKQHQLVLLEDACQAIGAVYGPRGQRAGAMGTIGCFSFFPSKNLGGFGDGGMVVTNKKPYADHVLMLRQHGSRKRYYHEVLGMNSRLDALQAAILEVKLKHLEEWIEGRIKKAAVYSRLIERALGDAAVVPFTEQGNTHTYHQYVVRFPHLNRKRRDALVAYMTTQGIGVNVYYPQPCHLQKCFAYLKYRAGDLPVTERAAATTMSLPIYPELTGDEQEYIVRTMTDGLARI